MKTTTATAAIHFAGEQETYAFCITGPDNEPAYELSRFMELIEGRIEDIDPFTLQLKAIAIFEGASRYRCEVECLEVSLAEAEALMAVSTVSQLRTI